MGSRTPISRSAARSRSRASASAAGGLFAPNWSGPEKPHRYGHGQASTSRWWSAFRNIRGERDARTLGADFPDSPSPDESRVTVPNLVPAANASSATGQEVGYEPAGVGKDVGDRAGPGPACAAVALGVGSSGPQGLVGEVDDRRRILLGIAVQGDVVTGGGNDGRAQAGLRVESGCLVVAASSVPTATSLTRRRPQ